MEITVFNGFAGAAWCSVLLCATLLFHPEFESMLLLPEVRDGFVNILTVTLEKLSERVVLNVISGLFFCVPHKRTTLEIGHFRIFLCSISDSPNVAV